MDKIDTTRLAWTSPFERTFPFLSSPSGCKHIQQGRIIFLELAECGSPWDRQTAEYSWPWEDYFSPVGITGLRVTIIRITVRFLSSQYNKWLCTYLVGVRFSRGARAVLVQSPLLLLPSVALLLQLVPQFLLLRLRIPPLLFSLHQ